MRVLKYVHNVYMYVLCDVSNAIHKDRVVQ